MLRLYDVYLDKDVGLPYLKEQELSYQGDVVVHAPLEIVMLLNNLFHLDTLAEEHCYMLAMNAKGKVLGICLVSKGDVCSAILNPRNIFMRALLLGAVFIVLVHNHPSGSPCPSKIDVQSTKRIVDAGTMIGVEVRDHIIVGNDQWSSMLVSDGTLWEARTAL